MPKWSEVQTAERRHGNVDFSAPAPSALGGWGGRLRPCMKYLWKPAGVACWTAALMQISSAESTYYKQLTSVLIYWIVMATESLKADPLTSSFLQLLTPTGRAWQVEVPQSSLIMWNKSIIQERVCREAELCYSEESSWHISTSLEKRDRNLKLSSRFSLWCRRSSAADGLCV